MSPAAEEIVDADKLGIGTEDEDLGKEEGLAGAVPLPDNMVESLRVDLAIWRRKP